MTGLWYLIPVSIVAGTAALLTFFWSLRSGQYDDLDGAAERILYADDVPGGASGTGVKADPEEREENLGDAS